ncbi:BlaI/MecI/CopY family transcriptional regulator [Patescibacteria group bacterium]|nr:BlaI/MecI/CopY family transcriptional regulator [Patescibacteria group bacterium]
MIEKYLEDAGLSDKEAAIYLQLIKVDQASVVELSQKTKIKRPTVYTILDSLAKKGLVSEVEENKKTKYMAESPEMLRTYIERKEMALGELKNRFAEDIIPQIKSLQRESGEKPLVKYYSGKEGIISINEDVYDSNPDGSPVYILYSKDLLDDVFKDVETGKYRKVRKNENIKAKVLYNWSKGQKEDTELTKRLKVDESKYPFYVDMSIYKDKVRISILGKKLSAIYIESKDFAETLKSLFNLAFDNLKK